MTTITRLKTLSKAKSFSKAKFFNKVKFSSRSKAFNKVINNAGVMTRFIAKVTRDPPALVIDVSVLSSPGMITPDQIVETNIKADKDVLSRLI